jgi:hypothetical protein
MHTDPSRRKRAVRWSMALGATVLVVVFLLHSFVRGPVDTTKDYYYDHEVPEFQVYVRNGVETLVPWDEVPEDRKFITGYVINGVWPSYRIPIARVEVIAIDEDGKPDDREKPYRFIMEEIGLNPEHVRHARGGYGAR